MKCFFRVGFCLVTLPLSTNAQTFAPAHCVGSWELVQPTFRHLDIPTGSPNLIKDNDGWCQISGLTLNPDGRSMPTIEVETVAWRGIGLEDFVAGGSFPSKLEVSLSNIRVFPQVGDPVMDFSFRAQSIRNGVDADFAMEWDAAESQLKVTQFHIDFPGDNNIRAFATLDGVDDVAPENISNLMTKAALKSLTVQVESNGLFESTALLPLSTLLLSGDETVPEQVAKLKSDAISLLATLPSNVYPADSHRAVTALIDDLPNPSGLFTLDLEFANGFSMPDAIRTALIAKGDPIAAIPQGLHIEASYKRSEIRR